MFTSTMMQQPVGEPPSKPWSTTKKIIVFGGGGLLLATGIYYASSALLSKSSSSESKAPTPSPSQANLVAPFLNKPLVLTNARKKQLQLNNRLEFWESENKSNWERFMFVPIAQSSENGGTTSLFEIQSPFHKQRIVSRADGKSIGVEPLQMASTDAIRWRLAKSPLDPNKYVLQSDRNTTYLAVAENSTNLYQAASQTDPLAQWSIEVVG